MYSALRSITMATTEQNPQSTTEAATTTEQNSQSTTEVATTTRQRPHRDPFDRFDELQQDMARRWSQTFPMLARPFPRHQRRMAATTRAWLPTTDVYEQDGKLVVKAELPGMKKEDISVELGQGDLVITAERQAEREVKDDACHREERVSGRFYRRIPLNFEVKPDQIQARYADGVLEVQVARPVQEQPTTQKIAVQ
jgi:HSP20 family protein